MKIKIILLTLGIIFLTSCGGEYTATGYYVKNTSSHYVRLTVFNAVVEPTAGFRKDTTYLLPELSEIRYGAMMTDGNNLPDPFPFGSPDSAFVTFDDTLRVTYKPHDANPRNILDRAAYSEDKRSKHLYRYYYSITEEDYTKAKRIKK